MRAIFLVAMMAALVACGGGAGNSPTGGSSVDLSGFTDEFVQEYSWSGEITGLKCSGGWNDGVVAVSWIETDGDNKLESGENIVSQSPVLCPSHNGSTTVYGERFEQGDVVSCPAGGYYADVTLGTGEMFSLPVCDGEKGETIVGQDGVDGIDGAPAPFVMLVDAFFFTAYDGTQCVYHMIGKDFYQNGSYDGIVDEITQQYSLCDGRDFSYDTFLVWHAVYDNFKVSGRNTEASALLGNVWGEFLNITHIELTGTFHRPRPDGVVLVTFGGSNIQCWVGDQNPSNIGDDTYTVQCPVYDGFIPANTTVDMAWQVGPKRNSFSLESVKIFSRNGGGKG